MKTINLIKIRAIPFMRFFMIALWTIIFGAAVGILGDAIKGEQPFGYWLIQQGWLPQGKDRALDNFLLWSGQLGGLFLILVLLAWFLYRLLPKEAPVRQLAIGRDLDHCRALITFPSKLTQWQLDWVDNQPSWVLTNGKDAFREAIPSDLTDAIVQCERIKKAGKPYIPMEQLLRLVASASRLTYLDLVCSNETLALAESIKRLLNQHFRLKHIDIVWNNNAINTEDIGKLYHYLGSRIQILQNKQYEDRQIVLDTTSGQKTCSIASAAITLHNDLCFAYVSTHNGDIYTYHLKYDDRASIGP